MNRSELAALNPKEVRKEIRKGNWKDQTAGLANGHVQANLVVLPKEWAYDFLVFAQRNPKPCPLLDVTEPGDPEPRILAPEADLRTDLPRYRVWEKDQFIAEPENVKEYWRDDLVSFLLGCSFTFERALMDSGIPVRHIEMGCNVPMYITNIQCKPAGKLKGPMVVSMRPIPEHQVSRAVLCSGRFPSVHGAPVHIGNPSSIGISNIDRPDFGDPVRIDEGEIPVFWACGVTPQAILMASRPSFAITHFPGHMFIGDPKDSSYSVF